MKNKIFTITFFLFIFLVIIFAVFIVLMNFPLSGEITYQSKFNQSQPALSSLGPPVRIDIKNGEKVILANPVYFELRSMPWFTKAQVKIVYQQDNRELTGFGWQTAPGFNYQVIPNENIYQQGEDLVATFDLDLKNIYQQKNIRRFLIETSSYLPDGEGLLKIKSLEIKISR
jgi:hypothetical protein